MPKLVFDEVGKRFWETGVSKGVLFPMSTPGIYGNGVAWNGLVNVTQSPTGAEASAIYADNIKYLSLMSIEELEASIEAYTYPDEFAECDGSAAVGIGVKIGQQYRKMFALAYQSKIGNDQNPELGYKIHIIYGCFAGPSEKSYDSVNDSPEAITFSWDITTTPVDVTGFKPTASIEIDSTKVAADKLLLIEEALYGTVAEPAELLMPNAVMAILGGTYEAALTFVVMSALIYQLANAPFPAAINVYEDGAPLLGAGTDYTYTPSTGIVTFQVEPTGLITITAVAV